MLWLAVHLPLLSLEAFCVTLDAARREGPVALLQAHRIAAVNPAAARCGVQTGSQRATALALAPALVLGQADAARDARALQSVVHAALAFTPSVALHGTQTVLMEVQTCLRYWGGVVALQARLHQALAPLGHHVQLAGAPTALGAALLAAWREDCAQGPHLNDRAALQALLDAAPVWLLGPGREHWEALQGMGLQTLSDLRALPRSGLARRFGTALLDDLDRARGERADPRRWLQPPTVFDSQLELFARADSSAQVLHGAEILLARLVAWAQARQSRVVAFTLRMLHDRLRAPGAVPADEGEPRHDGPPHTALRIELAVPSADPAHLRLVLRERLARQPLPAPTLELRLHCRELLQAAAPSGELFATRQAEAEGLLRLLERLRARLGDERVQPIRLRADHRPEHAAGLQAGRPPDHRPQDLSPTPPSMLPLTRPVWLLPVPQPLPERQSVPWHEGRPLTLLCGPDRIEAGWWDGAPTVRDYFIAQDEHGVLLWLYRTRLPAAVAAGAADSAADGWHLHGRFG